MTGLARLNSAVDFSALGVGPNIVIDTMDAVVMRMPGLVHYIDPARFVGVKKAKSRGDGGTIQWTTDNLVAVEADTGLNMRPAFHFLTANTDMLLPLGTPTASFTLIAVAQIDATRYAGNVNSYLWSSWQPTFGYEVAIQHSASVDLWSFNPEANTSGNGLNIAQGAPMPVGDQLAVWGMSYDDVTKTSEIYIDDALNPVGTKTHTQSPRTDPTMRWTLGCIQFNTTLGWVGKMGRAFVFDQPFHTTDPLRNKLDGLVTALKTFYAIP